jgi:hypothetical protein
MPTLSKQNTQTNYVANKYMLYGYCWLQSVKIFYFYVKKLNEIKQEIQKSTYFVFHRNKTQKAMSTFFNPCFVGAFSCVAIAAPSQL